MSKVNIHESFVKAVMTNEKISEDDRSKIIAEMIDEFSKNYPDLEHTATKQELSETELRLIKEIKELDSRLSKEIKELDSRLTKQIKELDSRLTKKKKELDSRLTKKIKDLELKLIKEIKELDSRLSKEIEGVRLEIANTKNDIIKWVIGLMFAQSALIVGVIKFLN